MNVSNILYNMRYQQKLRIKVWSETIEQYCTVWSGVMNDLPAELERLRFYNFSAEDDYLVLECKH